MIDVNMNGLIKRFFLHLFIPLLVTYTSLVLATAAEIKITNPTGKDILFGSSRIDVHIAPELMDRIVSVDFFLGAYPRPICRDNEYPYECIFDAGEFFEGWQIAVKAYDENGKFVASDQMRTRAFPKPVRVTKYILENVPVRIIPSKGKEPLKLTDKDFECLFGEDECKVTSARKLSELLNAEEAGALSAYLEILVDVSGSMNFSREKVNEALQYLVDHAPMNTKIRFSTFSDYNSLNILTTDNGNDGYTSDKDVIKDAIEKMGPNIGKSCIFHSVEKLIYRRPNKEVFRNILLITDCMDTCDWIKSRNIVATFSKEFGYIIDLLKIGHTSKDIILQKACESMANETSGTIFRAENGEDTDLIAVMKEIVSNLYEIYILDIDLPDHVSEEAESSLQLKPRKKKIQLKYAKNRLPSLLDSISLEMLKSDELLIRRQALRRLNNSDDPEVMKKIFKAYKSEQDHDLKIEELMTIYHLIGSNLLHTEDLKSHKLAIKAANNLYKNDPELIEPIKPFLETYIKTGPPEKLKKEIILITE